MTQPTQQTPVLAPYRHYTLDELDHRALRAERLMNLALEQCRWHAVQRHRNDMLAVDEELERRLNALDDDLSASQPQEG